MRGDRATNRRVQRQREGGGRRQFGSLSAWPWRRTRSKTAPVHGREVFMKFIATFRIPQDKYLPILKRWISMSPQEQTDAGEGVRIIGRWFDSAARSGVVILESNELTAVHRYIGL